MPTTMTPGRAIRYSGGALPRDPRVATFVPVRRSWHRATNQGARQQFKVSSCADIPMTVLDTADAAPGSASSWRMQWTIARVVVAAGRRDLNIRTLSLSSPRGGLTSLIQEFPLSWSR